MKKNLTIVSLNALKFASLPVKIRYRFRECYVRGKYINCHAILKKGTPFEAPNKLSSNEAYFA